MKYRIEDTGIGGLVHIVPEIYRDSRGYFLETFNVRDIKKAGIEETFVQDNESMSAKGVLRGLHFQTRHPQGKLVSCIKGRVLDVAVDLRNS